MLAEALHRSFEISGGRIRSPLAWAAIVAVLTVAPPTGGHAADWITFDDVSATNIVTDNDDPDPVGTTDEFEKDFAVGDFDRDGDPDLVVVRKVRFSTAGGKRNALYMNEGGVMVDRSSTLAPGFADATDDRDVVVVDVDNDQWPDLVTATTFSEQPRVYMNLGETLEGGWLGFEWNSLDARLPVFVPGPKYCAVVAGDVDNDTDQDLFFVDYDNTLEDRLVINDGSGFFTDETDTRMSAATSQSAFGTDAQIVDMNGDGYRDIVKLSTLSDFPNSIRIIYNSGPPDWSFTDMDHVYTLAPYMMEVADFNNDDSPDIFAVDDNQDRYLLNQGNDGDNHATFSTLTVSSSPSTDDFGGNTATGDLDRDGYLDILVADVDTDIQGCSRQGAALRNQGNLPSPTLYDPFNGGDRPWINNGVFDYALIDVNGDGWLDVWAGTCDGNRLYLSTTWHVFTDGFESGDVSEWSSSTP